MAEENPSRGEGHIANELSLKLVLAVDPRTVGKYLKQTARPRSPFGQRGAIFFRNHANAIVACDFFTSVTAPLQVWYVLVAIEIGSRRILHYHGTDHPTAEWTRQQFREFLDGHRGHRYVVDDRDCVFSDEVGEALTGFGLTVVKTPARSPRAGAHGERIVGTIRGECLDFLIPLNQCHLRRILREFVEHSNRGRQHTALGPGFPEPTQAAIPVGGHRYRLATGRRVAKVSVLGGLHHKYRLEEMSPSDEIIPDDKYKRPIGGDSGSVSQGA